MAEFKMFAAVIGNQIEAFSQSRDDVAAFVDQFNEVKQDEQKPARLVYGRFVVDCEVQTELMVSASEAKRPMDSMTRAELEAMDCKGMSMTDRRLRAARMDQLKTEAKRQSQPEKSSSASYESILRRLPSKD